MSKRRRRSVGNNFRRPVFFYGKKINLSPIEDGDLMRLYRWVNDPDVYKYIAIFRPMTVTEEKDFIASASSAKNSVRFAVLHKKTNEHIGSAALDDIHWKNGTATFGFMIGEKKYWGNGYGTDTLATVLKYAFETLNLWKVRSAVVALNTGSFKCHEKCGFRKVGTYRKEWVIYGVRHDVFLLEINRDEWIELNLANNKS